MNKLTLALVLGAGLTLSLAGPGRPADAAAIQTITPESISASTFNQFFTPFNTAVLSPYQFDGATGPSGLIESQVFQGTGQYAGTFAYAYQVAANANDGSGAPSGVDSTAMKFNATPLASDLTNSGKPTFAYVVQNGQIGGLDLSGSQAPTTLSWQANQSSGIIRAQYVDPASQTQPLSPGSNSATFVLLTTQMPASTKPSVNVGGDAATTTVPVAYSASAGSIEPIPVPEPATILAWAGMAGAVALVRRFRKARLALA
jgi:hypothetical protein